MSILIRMIAAAATLAAAGAWAQAVSFLPPASLNFGNTPVGTSSPTQSCTFRNNSTSPVTITSMSADGNRFFFRGESTCHVGVSLPPGGTCQLTEVFFPNAPGNYNFLATITTPVGTASCALSGTGVASSPANVSITPTSLNFGNVTFGTTSPAQVVTVRNQGTSPVNFGANVTGAAFTKTTDCTTTLNPGQVCTMNVTFTPPSTGPFSGVIGVSVNGVESFVSLAGTGVAPAPPPPAGSATLSPSSHNFGSVQVGTTSASHTFTLTNGTSSVLLPITVSVSSPFTQSNNCTSLGPGSSCVINVRFAPTSPGGISGSLVVNAGGTTLTSVVSGIGTSVPVTSPSGLLTSVTPGYILASTSAVTTQLVTYRFSSNTSGVSAVSALFCSQLVTPLPPGGATATNPCAPGSELAGYRTRSRNFQVTQHGGFVTEARETVVIPLAVAQAAYQRAAAGHSAVFYFVRRFQPEGYAVVEVRLAGNSAAAPINLYDVRLGFVDPAGGDQPLVFVRRGEPLPPLRATIFYTGAGLLRGSWEIVEPGHPEPDEFDLLPGASLSAIERARQRRYTVVQRFEHYLPAVGRFEIPIPDTRRFRTEHDGAYRVILRIEPQLAISGSDIALTGGAAPFPLPTLRYFVGSQRSIAPTLHVRPLAVQGPAAGATFTGMELPRFAWQEFTGARYFRLEIADREGNIVYSALERATQRRYDPAAVLRTRGGNGILRWRVVALSPELEVIGASAWSEMSFR